MTDRQTVSHVFVTVAGGVAYVAKAPKGVAVHIIDYDDIASDAQSTLRNFTSEEMAFYKEMEKGLRS
ncbi:MAG: hypothetical protein ABR865_01025 [Terracidiphilus sp.]|jgi:hypothetical protein